MIYLIACNFIRNKYIIEKNKHLYNDLSEQPFYPANYMYKNIVHALE